MTVLGSTILGKHGWLNSIPEAQARIEAESYDVLGKFRARDIFHERVGKVGQDGHIEQIQEQLE